MRSGRLGIIAETLAATGSATLAGVACCGPIVIQWLGLLVWGIGGRMLLVNLLRYEVPILLVIAAVSLLGRRLAADRPTQWANTLLVGVATFLAGLRLVWEIRRGIVMAFDPVHELFSYRQSILLGAAIIVLVARLWALSAALFHRRGTIRCRRCEPDQRRAMPTADT
ncbi:MAG: hypothetical protein ACRDJW_09990 [Thermomicrobiales bacterium]